MEVNSLGNTENMETEGQDAVKLWLGNGRTLAGGGGRKRDRDCSATSPVR